MTGASPAPVVAGVLYDHDGTVVDSLAMVVEATNRALARNGFAPEIPAAVITAMSLTTAPRMGHHARSADVEMHHHLAREFFAEARVVGPQLSRAYAGIAEVVETIATRGLPQGIISNNEGEVVRLIMRQLGLARHFALIHGEEDVPAPKPAPAGLLQAARLLGLSPASCLYVGDSGGDAQAARAAGMRAVGVTWGTHARQDMLGMGFDWLIDHPRELLPLVGSG